MLYGHIESYTDRLHHMEVLREAQDKTGGFQAFIPLSFQPHDNDMGINSYTGGEDDLRTIAVSRLYIDNFDHIKAYWVMLGQDIAQLALISGANDLDGTVSEEKISRMAGGRSGHMIDRAYIHSLIEDIGKTPTERNTVYDVVKEFSSTDQPQSQQPFSTARISTETLALKPLGNPSFGKFFLGLEEFKKKEARASQDQRFALDWSDVPFRSPQRTKVTVDQADDIAGDGSPIVRGARNQDPRFKLVGLLRAANIDLVMNEEEDELQEIYQFELQRKTKLSQATT